ncbi:MAG: hypothetical protein HY363_01130 [Candidatus Aenigmarchaeota archaeon]|nr:hypothetical protein [Candidatus Aenigmarchaeota archaeon]
MKTAELVFVFIVLLVILALVVLTANIDVLFPTPSPVEFAKTAINAT